MKTLLIALIVIILLIFGYNKYADYNRFHPETTDYKISDGIDLDYYDQETVQAYYSAVSSLNTFVTAQWSANGIDVRNPEDANASTKTALQEFAQLKAEVSYLEDKLKNSKAAKEKGLDNLAIRSLATTGKTPETLNKELEKAEKIAQLKTLFTSTSNNGLRVGSAGPLVFELQKLLIAKGHDIPVDGVFQRVTFEALKTFEASKNLYPDGKLDMLTLEHLLQK